ncbi:hypothetical protein L9F63_016486 [Diploptera punctata]|uniref:Uncharacterized protein n=1 Tax=Diploptera punctata TaxID=6984 RepID=A0AAD8EHI2_DIPPU|nr:hypothetical protein L9F63_016486 [Diploptera punctata]
MKWTAVVLMCSIVHLASVNCQCDLGNKVDYDPKMVEGSRYLVYSSPDIFEELSKIQIEFTLEEGAYFSTRNITFKNVTETRVFNSTWKINSDKDIDAVTPEIPKFNAVYRLLSKETRAILIFKSCPAGNNGTPIILVLTDEQCPKEETVQHALADVGLDITNFSKDPAVDCGN